MGFVLPQFGIFAQGTHAHHFLEFDLRPGITPTAAVASFRRLRTPEVSAGGVNLVVAFGADAWREVAPSDAPASLDRFPGITAPDGRGAPATQHDAWMWISGSSPDVTFDHARAAANAVADVALLVAEQPGFTYHEGRDETGFVDGTANPPVRHAADVALVPPGEPGQGGSHVLAMRWVHDLDAFHSLPVDEQEGVIGRTKVDSAELAERRQATHRAHRAGRDRGRRPRATDLPSERPVRERRRARPLLRGLQRGSLAVRADARAHVRELRRWHPRSPHGLLAGR